MCTHLHLCLGVEGLWLVPWGGSYSAHQLQISSILNVVKPTNATHTRAHTRAWARPAARVFRPAWGAEREGGVYDICERKRAATWIFYPSPDCQTPSRVWRGVLRNSAGMWWAAGGRELRARTGWRKEGGWTDSRRLTQKPWRTNTLEMAGKWRKLEPTTPSLPSAAFTHRLTTLTCTKKGNRHNTELSFGEGKDEKRAPLRSAPAQSPHRSNSVAVNTPNPAVCCG